MILFDLRENEWLGALDQIGGGIVEDSRVDSKTLAALNDELAMDLNGQATAVFDLQSVAGNMTLVVEGTLDGVVYYQLPTWSIGAEVIAAATFAAGVSSLISAPCQGFRRVRCRVSSYTSGDVVVTGRASFASRVQYVRHYPVKSQTSNVGFNNANTLTIAAPGAGLFHYITHIHLIKRYGVAGVAAGAGITITTTNLNGRAWYTEQLGSPAGTTVSVVDEAHVCPIKSDMANTPTTFVAPVQAETAWSWNVAYFVGS